LGFIVDGFGDDAAEGGAEAFFEGLLHVRDLGGIFDVEFVHELGDGDGVGAVESGVEDSFLKISRWPSSSCF